MLDHWVTMLIEHTRVLETLSPARRVSRDRESQTELVTGGGRTVLTFVTTPYVLTSRNPDHFIAAIP